MLTWNKAVALILKIIDAAKLAFIFLFIKKSVETKIRYGYLKKQSQIQKKQLKISARPRRSWNELLERMSRK